MYLITFLSQQEAVMVSKLTFKMQEIFEDVLHLGCIFSVSAGVVQKR